MKILVVDDEERFADRLIERLKLRGFDALAAYDGTSALSRLREERFEKMILDLRLPDIGGDQVLERALDLSPDIHVVILSGHGSQEDFERCMALGARACLQKPAKIQQVIRALGFESESAQP